MHFQQTESAGPGAEQDVPKISTKVFTKKSSSLPFGQDLPLESISGPTYLTAQTLVQQVAYTLSDKIFAYSNESFDLDVAVKHWQEQGEKNAFGYETGISSLETRTGAGAIALGYIFSRDFDLKKRHIPQSILASSSTLAYLRSSFDQLSALYSVANPLTAHIAAVDYSANSNAGLVTDYVSSLTLAEDLGLGLVCSPSVFEAQHMALFATLLSSVLPTVHTYDGISVGRETARLVDTMDQTRLHNNYQAVLKAVSEVDKKHSDTEGRVLRLLQAFNDELGEDYKLFDYYGHEEPESVLVVFGTVEASLTAQVANALSKDGDKVGVINVRVYRPFVEEAFLEALPKSTRRIAVLGQVKDEAAVFDSAEYSRLYSDVLAATQFAFDRNVEVTDVKYSREQVWTPSNILDVFRQIHGEKAQTEVRSYVDILNTTDVKQYTFWDLDESSAAHAPVVLGKLLSHDSSKNVFVRSGHDNLVQGGVTRTDIRNADYTIEAPYSVEQADIAFIGDLTILQEFDVLNSVKPDSSIIVKLPGIKDEDLETKLSPAFRKALVDKDVELFVLDPTLSEALAEDATLESYLIQLAFLKVAREDLLTSGLSKLAAINGSSEVLEQLSQQLESALREVEVPATWATVEEDVEPIRLPSDINVNSFAPFDRVETEPPTLLKDWQIAAKGFAFKEAFGTDTQVRPDLGVKTSIVTVKEHRRLTPLTYDRNIFHIEFDLGNSGVTYAIGEALGIHAENDKVHVEEFIKWYGLNPDEIVEVPSREDPNVLVNRTVYQSLMQNVDIFGRPPKRFYESLAEFADDEGEKNAILKLLSPEGASEFKRRAEVDFVTFADILLEFPSAHPSFHDIVRIVSPMKRREYSIASAQNVTPNSVALLIVTVNWVDPKGRDRFGQATRYLNALHVGAPVTVSVKPSVMKLPTKTTAPIIMAGLGTGLAPFRAFVQERAYQKQQGHEIGEVLLYMGSRTQREEYLFGEEWEAYQDAGIITLLGRAFSRDQPQKIYIQDRMRETLSDIRRSYIEQEGSFYLCGPTWPVPDVTEVLQEAIEVEHKFKNPGAKKVDSRKEIEKLKDEGRYVLEVY
ncbi:sulfite reductase-like protein alpha subunit [Cucurbitaria berberidis CBS 394.84]|uniref:assimilatory sulfite reductase (NADPH) n=1 Tax=Cucurbitaria berberidis CBS 394.84 TaxID=1168544 RepID=A0A9P4GS05_9PLEO|nr:sulfite reductase-like protein alpha subunit [Cucurbitaria berberidis CBS 394.84]KAF1850285.1 sulfite reductase-like protein alpha subunit [Cucurbitaria berberidis CBS 394.84]